ncbi:MAG: alcohol dehydrogenase catalytic domain-containing protein [Anaerolineales bacterium]|nr:alcohol dehydrogenase catalytic domain-containing protein [Anaerolineales bacterium]
MKALWLENNALSFKSDIPRPNQPNEALIRIVHTGLCGTDLEMVKGYYPFTGIPGHEFVGEVVEAPEQEWIGKRVVGEINVVCHQCEQCRSGRPTHCENRSVLGIKNRHGTLAEFTTLPLENLHPIPETVSNEAAVFTEPLAAALEITQQVQIRAADRVLLIGAGRLGQLIAQTLALTGCRLAVIARHDHQKELLSKHKIRLISEKDIQPWSWDFVVEATGSTSGLELARKALRPRGILVLKSTYAGDTTLNLSSFVVDEITVIGSRCGPFGPALQLLETRKVDPTGLISAEFRLEDGLAAFKKAAERGICKVLVSV